MDKTRFFWPFILLTVTSRFALTHRICSNTAAPDYSAHIPTTRYFMHRRRRTVRLALGLVLMSSCLEDDVITVREAAWLTDNTYTYEEVVRTIGEVLSVCKGCLQVGRCGRLLLTDADGQSDGRARPADGCSQRTSRFALLLLIYPQINARTGHVFRFISELTILHINTLT